MKTIGPLNLYNGISPLLSNMKDMVVTSVCGFKLFQNSTDKIFFCDSDIIIQALGTDTNNEIPWDIFQPKPSAEFFVIGSVHSEALSHNVPFFISCGGIRKSLIAHAPGFMEDGFFKSRITYNSAVESIPIRYPTESVINELSYGLRDGCTCLSSFSQNLDTIFSIKNFDSSSYICQHPISSKLLNPTKLLSTLPEFFKSDKYPIMIDYFDSDLFYRAHSSQRISRYWRGDESFELNGFHPVCRNYISKLPGVNFKLFYTYKKNSEIYSSVNNIDTIIFIPDSEVCLVVSRAIIPDAGVEFSNVDVVMPAFEYSSNSRSDEYYHKIFTLRTMDASSSDFVVHDAQLSPSSYSLSDVNRFIDSSGSDYDSEMVSEVVLNNNSESELKLTNNRLNPEINLGNPELPTSAPIDFSFSGETDTSLSDGSGGFDIASSNIDVDKSSNLLLDDSRADFTTDENGDSFDEAFSVQDGLSELADIKKLIELSQTNLPNVDEHVHILNASNLTLPDDVLKFEAELNSFYSMAFTERLAMLDKHQSIPDLQVDNDLLQQINLSLHELGLPPESIESPDSKNNDLSESISSEDFMSIISDLKKQLLDQQAEFIQTNVTNVLNIDGVEPAGLLDNESLSESIDSSHPPELPAMESGDMLADISGEVSPESIEGVGSVESQNVVSSPVVLFNNEPDKRVYEHLTFPRNYFNSLEFHNYTFRNCRFVGSVSQCKFSDCLFLDCDFSNTETNIVDYSASRFVGCNFSMSSHTNISIASSNFRDTNFNMALFSDSVITETDFHDSLLTESSFKNSKFTRLSIYSSNLVRSRFSESQFSKGFLLDSNFSHTTVIGSSFSDFKFTQSQLESASIENCSLNSASFIDSSLNSVSFVRVTAPELSMIDCSCCASHFSYCDFKKSTLIQCDFSSASLNNNNFANSSLNSSNLSRATVYKSQFVGGEFRLVNLTLATIKGCELLNVDLAGATLDSADFTDSSLPFDLNRYL